MIDTADAIYYFSGCSRNFGLAYRGRTWDVHAWPDRNVTQRHGVFAVKGGKRRIVSPISDIDAHVYTRALNDYTVPSPGQATRGISQGSRGTRTVNCNNVVRKFYSRRSRAGRVKPNTLFGDPLVKRAAGIE